MGLKRSIRALALAALVLGAVGVGVSVARGGLPGNAVGWLAIAIGLAVWATTAPKPPRADD
ncbi:MAG: hypothetical protein CL433_13220 [Acidimicrobiaceae bacterium]|nr:hypothetical protein [Acidimicrobiaceae bacterium]